MPRNRGILDKQYHNPVDCNVWFKCSCDVWFGCSWRNKKKGNRWLTPYGVGGYFVDTGERKFIEIYVDTVLVVNDRLVFISGLTYTKDNIDNTLLCIWLYSMKEVDKFVRILRTTNDVSVEYDRDVIREFFG